MLKKISKILVILLLTFILVINIPIIQVNHQESDIDYSNWMFENIEDDLKIVDLKMLGAHDAFSKDINIFSEPDLYADGIMKGLVGTVLKGYLVKQSVTQIADTLQLLNSGVRYLDIRLTYNNGEWTTKHNFTSSSFDSIASDIVEYLNEHDGEFLILDFPHINGLDYDSVEDYQIFLDMLEETGLFAFNYTNDLKELGEITYFDITNNKTSSSVIIVDKFRSESKETYLYETTIRSNWANNDSFSGTVQFLKQESELINESSEFDNSFKVMQAVTTMQKSLPGVLNSLTTYSLIERASDFNNYLIMHDDFEEIFNELPIIMVDYSNTNEDGFLDNIMQLIIDANT